jgi:predicted ATPase/DNA-binding CsgD family transcriptional regulator
MTGDGSVDYHAEAHGEAGVMARPTGETWRGRGRIDLARSPRAQRTPRSHLLPGSVPADTMLVGRDDLLAEVRTRVLGRHRVTTLTGPGGVGKTELALHLAGYFQRAGAESQGFDVRWVDLEPIGNDVVRRDGRNSPVDARTDDADHSDDVGDDACVAEIARAVAAALERRDYGKRTLAEVASALQHHFADAQRRILLVLDNCEHLVEDAAYFCQILLDVTTENPDKVRILCTSREALACHGEFVVNVPPLDYPDSDEDLKALAKTDDPNVARKEWPAIVMFRRLVAAFGNPVPDDDEHLRAVAAIVRETDGLPIAIQIAASLARQASLEEILTWTSAPVPARRRPSGRDHADRRAYSGRGVVPEGLRRVFAASARAKDWTEDIERVFQRLAIFDDGFPIDAAPVICPDFGEYAHAGAQPDQAGVTGWGSDSAGRGASVRPEDVPDLVRGLVDKSLVSVDTSATPARFRLLRPIRLYAWEQLLNRSPDEEDWLRERYVRYYYDRAADLAAHVLSSDELDVARELHQEMPNFRSSLAEACSRPALTLLAVGSIISISLIREWHRRGALDEGRRAVLRVAEATKALEGAESFRLALLSIAGWYALCQGEFGEAGRYLRECLGPVPAEDPDDYPCYVTQFHAVYLLWVDKDPRSIELAQLSVRQQQRDSDAVLNGQIPIPDEYREVAKLCAEQGRVYGVLIASMFSALAAAFLGDKDVAQRLTQDFIDGAEQCGMPTMIAWSRIARALALMRHSEPDNDDLEQAQQLAETTLRDMIELGEGWGAVWAQHLAITIVTEHLRRRVNTRGVAHHEDRAEALRLAMWCGAARKVRETSNVQLRGLAGLELWHQSAIDVTREIAGSLAWEEAESTGHELDEDQAVRFGTPLDTVDMNSVHRPIPDALREAWDALSPQEQAVTYYVSAGHSGQAIKARLHIQESTVDEYVKRAKEKLGITGPRRTEFPRLHPFIARLWCESHPTAPRQGDVGQTSDQEKSGAISNR